MFLGDEIIQHLAAAHGAATLVRCIDADGVELLDGFRKHPGDNDFSTDVSWHDATLQGDSAVIKPGVDEVIPNGVKKKFTVLEKTAVTIPQHSSRSNEHYTPKLVTVPSLEVMGQVDLDPASCVFANDLLRAKRIYTKRDNGLSRDWLGRVFLNPPGGALPRPAKPIDYYLGRRVYALPKIRSRAGLWWSKLVMEWLAGRTTEAIFVGFSLEIIRAAQVSAGLNPLDFPCVFPRERLKFDKRKGNYRIAGRSPTNANVIVYMPRHVESSALRPHRAFDLRSVERFRKCFSPLGKVVDTEAWMSLVIGGGNATHKELAARTDRGREGRRQRDRRRAA